MSRKQLRHGSPRGFLIVEVAAAVFVVGIILATTTAFVLSYRRAVDSMVRFRQAQLAAESYVEWARSSYDRLPEIKGVTFDVRKAPGEGDWSGLTRLEVKATATDRHGRSSAYRLVTYVSEGRS